MTRPGTSLAITALGALGLMALAAACKSTPTGNNCGNGGKRKIQLDDPIKAIGEYQVPIRLHREVTVPVKVVVEAEPEPAG